MDRESAGAFADPKARSYRLACCIPVWIWAGHSTFVNHFIGALR